MQQVPVGSKLLISNCTTVSNVGTRFHRCHDQIRPKGTMKRALIAQVGRREVTLVVCKFQF